MVRGEKMMLSWQRIRSQLKHELHALATAWAYFARIPLPGIATKRINYAKHSLEAAARYAPVIGICIGALAGAAFIALYELTDSKTLGIVTAMAAAAASARIMQEDTILPTLGVFALVIVVLTKFHALVSVPVAYIPSVMIAAHAFSRFAAGSFIYTHDYAQPHAGSGPKHVQNRMRTRHFVIMTFLGMVPLLLVGNLLFLLLVPILWAVRNLYGAWFIRKAGGYTHQTLGTTQQLIEAGFYVLVIISYKFAFTVG